MILYDASDWASVIFTCVGTAWPSIISKVIAVSLYAVVAYVISFTWSFNLGSEGRTILMGTMSFLLIFRANQAYSRYNIGRTMSTQFFTNVREFTLLTLSYIRGGVYTSTCLFHGGSTKPRSRVPEDVFDIRAREIRVDVVRMAVAIAVLLKLHTRIAADGYCFGCIDAETKWLIDWDRLRLRQLLTASEFQVVDDCIGFIEDGHRHGGRSDPLTALVSQFRGQLIGGTGPPETWPQNFKVETEVCTRPLVAMVFLTREMIYRNLNDGFSASQPWAVKERFGGELAKLLASITYNFEMVNQIVTTPLPLPYANLCKVLLAIFLLTMPFFIDYRLGWFANTIIPAIVSVALLGIDAIATELENPFGDDDNDLDILEMIHVLECEAVELLRQTGDTEGFARFCWRPVPDFIAASSCRRLRYHLAVRDIAPVEDLVASDDQQKEIAMGALTWHRSVS